MMGWWIYDDIKTRDCVFSFFKQVTGIPFSQPCPLVEERSITTNKHSLLKSTGTIIPRLFPPHNRFFPASHNICATQIVITWWDYIMCPCVCDTFLIPPDFTTATDVTLIQRGAAFGPQGCRMPRLFYFSACGWRHNPEIDCLIRKRGGYKSNSGAENRPNCILPHFFFSPPATFFWLSTAYHMLITASRHLFQIFFFVHIFYLIKTKINKNIRLSISRSIFFFKSTYLLKTSWVVNYDSC